MFHSESRDAIGIALDIISGNDAGLIFQSCITAPEVLQSLLSALQLANESINSIEIGTREKDTLRSAFTAIESLAERDGFVKDDETIDLLKQTRRAVEEVLKPDIDVKFAVAAMRLCLLCTLCGNVLTGTLNADNRQLRRKCQNLFDKFNFNLELHNILMKEVDYRHVDCKIKTRLGRYNVIADVADIKRCMQKYIGLDPIVNGWVQYPIQINYCKLWKTNPMTLSGHINSVRAFATVEGKLFSGSADCVIKVWDPINMTQIECLTGHRKAINTLAVWGKWLFSGSEDTTIRVWNVDSFQKIICLRTHVYPVCCLVVHNNKLYSASAEGLIKIWNLPDFVEVGFINSQNDIILNLQVYNNKLISGCRDSSIKIIDVISLQEIGTFITRGCEARCVAICDNKLYCCNWDSSINVVDLDTLTEIGTLKGHSAPVNSVVACYGKLLSGSQDNTIRVWDLPSMSERGCLTGHTQAIISMIEYKGCVFSGSLDNSILAHIYAY